MRTKKIKNNTEFKSESEILPLLNPDHTIDTIDTIDTMPVEQDLQKNIMETVKNNENTENVIINTTIVEKKKRGRKKLIKPDSTSHSNEFEQNDNNGKTDTDTSNVKESNSNYDNVCTILHADTVDKKEKKQRKIRISKKENQQNVLQTINNDICSDDCGQNIIQEQFSTPMSSTTPTIVHKKRGRKPRGGKIIHENQLQKNNSPEVPNIILHLKCVLSDLKKTNELNSHKLDTYCSEKKMEILCYNENDQNTEFSSNSFSSVTKYENDNKRHYNKDVIMKEEERNEKFLASSNQKYDPSTFSIHPTIPIPINTELNSMNAIPFSFSDKELNDNNCNSDCKNTNNKEIWKKISQLKLNFHRNDSLGIQRSSCFWDTCEFDTPPIHIPISSTKGYGCFCHPECAVAFLMNESIDTSVKFERYYLLNSIYGPIYNYNKSIKPAASPHYLLNKFYGSLTINEYRKLFQCDQVVYMVNKPLTNVLPELYEDNNEFFIGNKIIQNNTIEIKKKGTKNAKSSIINEAFGIR